MERFSEKRPLSVVRAAIERKHHALESLLRSHGAEIESRIKEAEDRVWRSEREVLELEGYLSRAAAVVGVDVGERSEWNKVVAGIDATRERTAALSLEVGRLRLALERAETAAGKNAAHAATLARVAARLGLSTLSPADLLHALDLLISPNAS